LVVHIFKWNKKWLAIFLRKPLIILAEREYSSMKLQKYF
jgi:hypothetical protein